MDLARSVQVVCEEIMLRMARTVTGAKDVITMDWAYHGHTQALIDVSPYKYKRKGGKGRPDTTWEAPLPDAYRAPADWPAPTSRRAPPSRCGRS